MPEYRNYQVPEVCIPEDWLQDMTVAERDQFNQEEDERIEKMLEELGFETPTSKGREDA